MGKVFEAARTCVIQCCNSDTPYRDVDGFCTALLSDKGWQREDVEEVQRHALRAILDMRRHAKRSPPGA